MPVISAAVLEQLLDTRTAAHLAGVTPAAISNWRERGYCIIDPETGERSRVHLVPAASDPRGRPLYRWIDIARAERHTRERAPRRIYAA